jgi:ABC-type uncharacterized transport system ATPase subunit
VDVTEVHIERFKSLKDLRMPVKTVSVLTGPNNAGKSSVLQAIQFATSIAQSAATYSTDLKSGTLAAEQLLYSPLRDIAALAPDMRFTQKPANEIRIAISAEMIPGSVETCQIRIRRGKNANVSYNVTDNSLGKKMSKIAHPFSVLVTGLAGIPRQEEWRSEGLVRKAAARGDANSVLRNVLWLLSRDAGSWARFNQDIAFVFPGVAFYVDFDPNIDDYINVTFAKGGARLPIDAVGTGVLQTIQILSYVNVYEPALLLLDEPDSHLHANNQRALARLLVRLSTERDFQVLMTTHSRHFLDELKDTAETFWFAEGQVKAQQFDVVQALVDLGALDAVDIFAAKDIVVLTEDSESKPIKALMEAAGANLATTVFRSFSGCSNIASTFPVADFIRQHAPGVAIVVHRDRDYELDGEIDTMVVKLGASGIQTFIPDATDIESCFIDPEHIHELYSVIPVADAQLMIDAATISAERKSLDRIVQRRCQQAGRLTQGGTNNINIPQVTRAAEDEYNANKPRFRFGKTVLGYLEQEIQRVSGRHPDLFRNSTALQRRLEVVRIRASLGL